MTETITLEIEAATAALAALHERRNTEIYAAVKGGVMRQAEAARRYGLTRQRVEQIMRHFAVVEAAGVGDE